MICVTSMCAVLLMAFRGCKHVSAYTRPPNTVRTTRFSSFPAALLLGVNNWQLTYGAVQARHIHFTLTFHSPPPTPSLNLPPTTLHLPPTALSLTLLPALPRLRCLLASIATHARVVVWVGMGCVCHTACCITNPLHDMVHLLPDRHRAGHGQLQQLGHLCDESLLPRTVSKQASVHHHWPLGRCLNCHRV